MGLVCGIIDKVYLQMIDHLMELAIAPVMDYKWMPARCMIMVRLFAAILVML